MRQINCESEWKAARGMISHNDTDSGKPNQRCNCRK